MLTRLKGTYGDAYINKNNKYDFQKVFFFVWFHVGNPTESSR